MKDQLWIIFLQLKNEQGTQQAGGLYFAQVKDEKGIIATEKIIKN